MFLQPGDDVARKTLWVDERAQVEALAHPARHEIVDRLTAQGPMGARELARSVGRQVTTVYHHLQLLEKVGLIEVASVEPQDRGRPYVVYKTKAARTRLTRTVTDPKLRGALGKWARVVGAEAAKQFSSAVGSRGSIFQGPGRNMRFFRLVCAPSPDRLKRINALFDELDELVWTSDPNPGPLLSIGWFLSPLNRTAQPQRPKAPKKPPEGGATPGAKRRKRKT